MAPIFVSYRADDAKAWALMLASELAERFGENQVFLDKDRLNAGSWRVQIEDALATCRVMLVVIGRTWVTSADPGGRRRLDDPDDVHRNEVVSALRRRVTVVPVLVDGASIPAAEQLPQDLKPLIEQQARTLADDSARRTVDFQRLFSDVQRATGLTMVSPQRVAPHGWPDPQAVAASARTSLRMLLTAGLVSVVALVTSEVGLGWTLDGAERGVIIAAMFLATLAVTSIYRWWRSRKPGHPDRAAASLVALALVRLAHPDVASAQPPATSVTCTPDSPLIHPGESVAVRAAIVDGSGRPLPPPIDFTWTASAGNISGAETARWSFPTDAAAGGRLQATARVSVRAGGITHDCTASLLVVEKLGTDKPVDRGILVAARTLLLPGVREESGYGLYSYLLMSAPPRNDVERDRALQTLRSLLLILQPVAEMERYRRRSEMNAVLVPVRQRVSVMEDLPEAEAVARTAARLLEQYDYARAQSLMAELGIDAMGSGPFIVARTYGPDGGRTQLSMDISHVAPKLASDWIATFVRLTAQERSWTDVALQKLLLNTRNLVAVAARESPEVLAALGEWFRLGRS